jgi:acyl-CoA reductase-like NAD-dependent aldehyde dehydrogenase
VLDDVDPALIGPELARMAFANCGQFCMAIKRLYVARPVYDAVCDAVAAAIASKRVGHALDPQSDIGPLQNAAHYQRIIKLLSSISDQGGRCLTGGAAMDGAGYFVSPTVVVGLNESSPLVCEEQFGPILPILPIDSPEEGLRLANAGRLGLGGSVWSADVGRATALARQLEVGTAWVNQHGILDAHYPMGGVKESGLGTEYGLAGLLQYTNFRVLNVNLDPLTIRGA